MKKRTKQKTSTYKPSYKLVATGGFLVLALAIGIYLVFFHGINASPNKITGTATDGSKVNLSPPTSSDKQAADNNKQAIVNRDSQLNNPSSSQTPKTQLIITDVTASVTKAYISGVFEDGGNCSATATQGSQTVSASSQGFENVSYTQCAPLNWQTPLGAGTWSVTVTYKSATTNVTATKTVQL